MFKLDLEGGRVMSGREDVNKLSDEEHAFAERYTTKVRTNINDLLNKRLEERKVDKKTNLIIFSGAAAVAGVLVLILNL